MGKIWPSQLQALEERWFNLISIGLVDTLCGQQVDALGFSVKDQRCAIRSIWVQTGRLITIGNTAQLWFVTIVPSLILCYMVFNSTHVSLLKWKSRTFQVSVQSQKPLRTYISTDPQKLTRVESLSKLWTDKSNQKLMRIMTQLWFMQKVEPPTVNTW